MAAVAYESFYYRALTGKILVFWIGGRLREVVAYERWSLMESQRWVLNLLKRLLSLQTPPLQIKKLVSWPFKLYPFRAMFIPKALLQRMQCNSHNKVLSKRVQCSRISPLCPKEGNSVYLACSKRSDSGVRSEVRERERKYTPYPTPSRSFSAHFSLLRPHKKGNGRAANWAPEVEFSRFRALSRRQMTFPFCC